MFIPSENPTADGGLFGLLTRGIDTWGSVAVAKAQAEADIYTRTNAPGSPIYGAGEPAGLSIAQSAGVGGSSLLVIAAIGAVVLVAVLVLKS